MDSMQKRLIAKRLEGIAKANAGRLTPEDVLTDAVNPKSPLHSHFQWDDVSAAHQYRLDQARQLIRSVHVEFRVDSKTVSTVRYVRDPAAGAEQGYIDVAKIRTEKDLSRDALATELEQVRSRLERARGLAEVFGLAGDVSEFIDRLSELNVRLNKAA